MSCACSVAPKSHCDLKTRDWTKRRANLEKAYAKKFLKEGKSEDDAKARARQDTDGPLYPFDAQAEQMRAT